ncbi:bifunctional diguanylate cyclase/phosphodiesterase [Photobacterium lutimaris]|uniref:GGDEF domain-containing protein n=1 Tax=Photobacterium lutimaris TaxID=388278 RepID=A0A2T3IZV1_9GAMM|nr:bifunctional diguanylate cyclase/phosphodiesterase [Photobacterium lutimaris]PSU34232.1 GGDEF domain-containing protein [Photobacterium lutimaris]TDR75820.1 PAS domain S-box-containing protein/diguanylate cyclase (GGDEF)-like protein [Photobacterium lutimaris]
MKTTILRFLLFFIPLLTITSASIFYIYSEDLNQINQRIQDRENSRHQSSLHITRLHFAPIIEDLRYLTEKAKELSNTSLDIERQHEILTASFLRLSTTRHYYDQVRLLNAEGQEVIRVNKVGDSATALHPSQLQDKGQRDYVKKALKIQPGGFYTSQFDLNQENGQIELPHKPMLRFVSHFKVNGQSWLITLNYLGIDYLGELESQYGWDQVQNWLVNNHGQWLLGPTNDSAWQFMSPLNQPKEQDFHTQYPQLWQDINLNNSGQIIIDDHLYTYTRFFSGTAFGGENSFTLPFQGSDLPWTIISRVNMTEAVTELAFTQKRILKLVIFTGLVISLASGCLVLAWHLSQLLNTQRKMTLKIEDTALQYATVLRHVPDGLMTLDQDMKIVTANNTAIQILSLGNKEIRGCTLTKLLPGSQSRRQVEAIIEQLHQLRERKQPTIKIRLQFNNLKTKHIEIIATETTYSSSREILLNLRDVTYWIEREEKLKSMSRALEQSNDSIIITDRRGVVEYVNRSFEKHNGITSKDIIGKQSIELLRNTLNNLNDVKHVQKQLKEGHVIERVIAHQQGDQQIIYEEKTIAPIRNSRGKISHYISTGKDITERVLFENRLHRLVHYDLLTELPNRTLLQQQLCAAVKCNKSTGENIALLSLDLDYFKQINDSLGHAVGDKVIQAAAKRVHRLLRETDILARLGGDEFAILLAQNANLQNVTNIATRILKHIAAPLIIEGKELFLTASIGISFFPDDSEAPEDLSKYADIALYRAKEQGRNQFCFYTSEMGIHSVQQIQLESELRRTLGSDRYEFFYQPKVNAKDHAVCGVEALLRWRNKYGEPESPLNIIPILERSGVIIEAGEYLIKKACRQLKVWQSKGIYLNFAINISAQQLLGSNIVETIDKAIIQTGCDPQYLEIEITETVIMSDVDTALDKLIKLEALGVKIAIDDFGTGYSSLAYLSRFPIHILKIDREFIKDLPWNEDNTTITRSIVELAHNLNMQVVAEGVETQSQCDFLSSIGVEEFQGYLFGRPQPVHEFEQHYLHTDKSTV